MKDLRYNYVIFNSVESKITFNPNGYYAICYNDIRDKDQVLCVDMPLQGKSKFLRFLYNIHHSARLNSIIKIPFKELWYPYYFKESFLEKRDMCFVLQIRLPISYLLYLKKKYKGCKFVSIYRDLRRITEIKNPEYPDNPIFDLQMTIDKLEAEKYGWIHFDEIESKINVPVSEEYPLSDVFFAGKAKDRLPRLLEAYDILTRADLKCSFYLTGVRKQDRVNLPGIVYADKFMPYSEMLYYTVNSRCVLEINQVNAQGYTSRFLEAVMFNKKLITDNAAVKESKFYTPNNIQCISTISDISPDFVKNTDIVDYHYKDEFSPVHLIEKIDQELSNKYGNL